MTARGQELLRFAYVLCGDHHLAQDLVQEVLAKVCGRWSRIESDNPDPYLRKAIVRTHLSWRMRRLSRETTVESPSDSALDADHPNRHALRDELWALLGKLSKTQRAVLILKFYEDLDDARIAEILGCAEATVRVHAHRGLAKLRTRLGNPTELPGASIGGTRWA